MGASRAGAGALPRQIAGADRGGFRPPILAGANQQTQARSLSRREIGFTRPRESKGGEGRGEEAPAYRWPAPLRDDVFPPINNILQQMDKKTMGNFDDSDDFNPPYSSPGGLQFPASSPLSWLPAAQYRPPSATTFPNPAAPVPGPLAIPPAQPPIFLSPPDPAGAAAAQPASGWGSIGQGLANGINNDALTLMALGAGIAQGGVGRGLAAAATAAEAERSRQLQQLNFLQTYKALTDGGVPPPEAQAAIGNPSLMRALAAKYLGPRSPGTASSSPAAPASAAMPDPNPSPPLAANYPGPNWQGNASNALMASAKLPATPPIGPAWPPNVPDGASYSPSRGLWRDRDGNLFDQQGKALN